MIRRIDKETHSILSLMYRRKRGEMIQVYKFLHKIWDIDEEFLTPAIDNRTRGHSLKFSNREPLNKSHNNKISLFL